MHWEEVRVPEPWVVVPLHPRLTVVTGDMSTRRRIVEVLVRLRTRGHLEGDIEAGGARVTCRAEVDGVGAGRPVLGADLMAMIATLDDAAAAVTLARRRLERAEARHRCLVATMSGVSSDGAREPEPAPDDQLSALRSRVVRYLGDLDRWIRGVPDAAPDLVERGTVLAGELARTGRCSPRAVRALLRAVDVVAGAGDGPPVLPTVILDEIDEEVRRGRARRSEAEADGPTDEMRGRALAAYAEQETARRHLARVEAAYAEQATRLGAGAVLDVDSARDVVRGRIRALAGHSPVGPMPVLLDDPLGGVARGDTESILDAIAEESARVQIVYVTDDAAVLEWAGRLTADLVSVVRLETPVALFPA